MIHRNKAVRTRTVVAGCALVATLGISAFASAGGDSAPDRSTDSELRAAPGAEPRGAIDPRERLRNLDVPVTADKMRTIPAPGPDDNASPWLLAPTRDGGVCVDASSFGFCGTDRASVEAGRASATLYPSGGKLHSIDPRTGIAQLELSEAAKTGAGMRYGIAPAEATEVVVLDGDGRVLRRETVSEEGAYRVKVPPQGSDARVSFRDASGDTIASRGAG